MDRPDTVWCSDITYLWTMEGWLYLAVVIDQYSRKVIGWAMSNRMKTSLVKDARDLCKTPLIFLVPDQHCLKFPLP
jgi:transposase InsO family protein